MKTKVIDLIRDDDVRALAGKDTVLAGHEIWAIHEVIFGVFRGDRIEAQVTDLDGTKKRTTFDLTDNRLKWDCSCSSPDFCRHLVAAALDAQRKGRGDTSLHWSWGQA